MDSINHTMNCNKSSVKTSIDIESWNRKEQFFFFSDFEDPFFGFTTNVNCTIAHINAANGSFLIYCLHRALKAANEVENFRYRIIDNLVYRFDSISASLAVGRPNGTFGFACIDYFDDENIFSEKALQEIDKVKLSNGLSLAASRENSIHFSAIPWIDFTSITHARRYSHPDSCPKISIGKVTEKDGIKTMPISIHGHHALMDGYHVGLFIDKFQELLNDQV